MSAKYDKAYFIAKFEAIPERNWCVWSFRQGQRCCALGHCGNSTNEETSEGIALLALLSASGESGDAAYINDGDDPDYQQKTPKARILAALHDLKE